MQLRFRMLALCLTVGLAWLPGPAEATHDRHWAAQEADASCLCAYDPQITTLPASPRQGDDIQVLCAGVWSDSCVPVYSCHEVQDGMIRVVSVCNVPPGIGCLTVLTPFCNFASASCLPAGTYRVQWYIADLRFDDVLRLCATGEFEVTRQPHSIYLPLLRRGA